jgi:hypothetical protein
LVTPEADASGRQRVHVRGAHDRIARAAHRVVTVIVGDHHQDV